MAGLIAFFDILGYQSFLENNSARESALDVLKFINHLPPQVQKESSELWLKHIGQNEFIQQVAKACKHLIFSDTIVVSVEYPDDATIIWKAWAFGYISLYASKLFGHMFFNGLPMRAAITEGEFVFVDYCLAGQAIIDAYKLCESLDFSGIVYQTDFMNNFVKSFETPPDAVSYISPLKNSTKEERLYNLNWVNFISYEQEKLLISDVETTVYRAFWKHKKDCPLSVEQKIKNTIKLIRRLLIELESKSAQPVQVNEEKK